MGRAGIKNDDAAVGRLASLILLAGQWRNTFESFEVLFSNLTSAMYFMYKSTYCLLARDFTIKVGSLFLPDFLDFKRKNTAQ